MKYVPPSVKETAFSCPHCGAFAQQYWLSVHADLIKANGMPVVVDQEALKITSVAAIKLDPSAVIRAERARKQLAGVPVTWSNRIQREFDILNIWMSKCFNCQKIAVWLSDRMIYPDHSEAPPANADLPEEIRRDYDEARAIMALSPRGAAALIRLAIQKLCRYLGQPGNNINDDIKSMVKGGLDPRVQKALDAVRVIGNSAVHPGQIDFHDDRAVAESLLQLLNLIADKMISEPKHVDEVYSSLPPSARKAIEERDGKPHPKDSTRR